MVWQEIEGRRMKIETKNILATKQELVNQEMIEVERSQIILDDGNPLNIQGVEWFDSIKEIGDNKQLIQVSIEYHQGTCGQYTKHAFIKPDGTAYKVDGKVWFDTPTRDKNGNTSFGTYGNHCIIKSDGQEFSYKGLTRFHDHIAIQKSSCSDIQKNLTVVKINKEPKGFAYILVDKEYNVLEYDGISEFDNVENLAYGEIRLKLNKKYSLLFSDLTQLKLNDGEIWFDYVNPHYRGGKLCGATLKQGDKYCFVDAEGIVLLVDGESWFDEIKMGSDDEIKVVKIVGELKQRKKGK